ncbi:MAG: MoaD/ThiS family protein [Anaerolineae bacterium]
MHITVKLYGNLRTYLGGEGDTAQLEVAQGVTVRQFLEQLGIPDGRVWMSAVNDQVVDGERVLQDGDMLEVFEPVGGGDNG